MSYARSSGILLSIVALLVGSFALPLLVHTPHVIAAKATPLAEAQAKAAAAKAKAEAAAAAAKQQAEIKAKADQKIKEVGGQITQLQGNIQQTKSSMLTTAQQIEQKNQEGAALESELRRVKDQQDALLRQLYIMRLSMSDSLVLFSDKSVSERETQEAQFSSLKEWVASVYVKTAAAKVQVEQARSSLVQHNQELAKLQSQQDEQKRGLASYQQTQAALKQNADAAMKQLEAQALEYRKQAAVWEAQVSALLSAAIKNASKGIYGNGPGVGQRVKRGTWIGVQGSTGFSTGDHVHQEVRVGDVPVNPQPYINNGTIDWALHDPNMRITQPFGRTSFSYVYAGGIHTGIDIAGPAGSAVYAPADGTVILNACPSSCGTGYGHAWAMQMDNGLVILLGHLRI